MADNIVTSLNNKDLNSFYFYLIPKPFYYYQISALPHCIGAIQNIYYNPFIDMTDASLEECVLDLEKYGKGVVFPDTPMVYRVKNSDVIEKELKTIMVNYDNDEPLLSVYPFKYYMVFDGFNEPLMVKPQLTEYYSYFTIKVKTMVSAVPNYLMYVHGYNGDETGKVEGLKNRNPLISSFSNDAYSTFLGTSSASFNAQYDIERRNEELRYSQNKDNLGLSTITNVIGLGASLFTGNIGGTMNSIGSLVGNGMNYQHNAEQHSLNEYARQTMHMATLKDLQNKPRIMSSVGTNYDFDTKVNGGAYVYEYGLHPNHLEEVRKYIKRFGYPVEEYTSSINLRSRKAYNFFKFRKCDIEGVSIPVEHLRKIESIYEQGVTLWHMDRTSSFKNYEQDNSEVSL